MSWSDEHHKSEQYAAQAETTLRQGDEAKALELYRMAARHEAAALKECDPTKARTFGITAVSAASLWYKAGDFDQAKRTAYQGLANVTTPIFAMDQLQTILQRIWHEEALLATGVTFSKGEVYFAVKGGQIVRGGAPLDLIVQKVDDVEKIIYRTIEMLLNEPFRTRGSPASQIQEQFRPWLFNAPPSSYQFAILVERPKQMTMFPNASPSVDEITRQFLEIVRASIDDPEKRLTELVPNKDYRQTFLKLTRNLAPTGKTIGQLEIRGPGEDYGRPIILTPPARDSINQVLRLERDNEQGRPPETILQLRGVLRGVQLDKDWIEITDSATKQTIHIKGVSDVVDDLIGPMVNHRVIVDVVRQGNGHKYRDIQPEE